MNEKLLISFFLLNTNIVSLEISTMSRTSNDSYSNAFLTHGDLWRQVLSFLPFSFVKSNLHSINHFFHDLAHAVTNPTMLGSLPVQVWSNHILPLLDCVELKNFQRVSQVSKILTLSPSFAKKMFRSDVDTKDLKSIKVGTNLADSRDYYAVNPFLDRIAGICAEPYESFYVYVYMSSKYIQRQSSKTHGVEQYSEFFESVEENERKRKSPAQNESSHSRHINGVEKT